MRSFQDILLQYTPAWLGAFLVRFRWGRKLLGFPEPEPLLWFDESGGGWRHPPEFLEADYKDVGQHDSWKWDMRLFLLRYLRRMPEAAGPVDLQDFGLAPRKKVYNAPRLFPVSPGLADACRRLGFHRLAVASVGEERITEADLRQIWERHLVEVEKEAQQRAERLRDLAKRGTPSSTSPEDAEREARIDLDLGPFDPPLGKDFPLAPFSPFSPKEPSR